MSATASMQSSNLSDALRSEAQANFWRGPTISAPCSTSSSSLTVKPAAASVRSIKRKPVPKIPTDLLQQYSGSANSTSTPTPSAPPVLREQSLNTTTDTDATPTKESPPSIPMSAQPAQRPQQQYLLNIDAPVATEDIRGPSDDTVQQLLRSASMSPSSAPARPRKGPLRWMQDKEEHSASASSSTLPSRQPTLSRKTSISAHLKLSLRRNKGEEQPAEITISGPTNFVHLSTGTDAAVTSSKTTSLRRASTTSTRSSFRSSMSSTRSDSSSATSQILTAVSLEEEVANDRPLYATTDRKHPLRPLKSIRRPSKLSLKQDEPLLEIQAGQTSPKDKRKAIYAAPGLVPAILEPLEVSSRSTAQASKLSPIVSPITSQAGEHFASALGRTLGRARGLGSECGELSPEPELSRSPSSGYESSACSTSNRSSLGSLQEFRTFLDFPDMPPGSRRNSEKSGNHDDIWAAPELTVPLTIPQF
ncbi:uncharacterized protein UTRI_02140 [Ustilago trichophora]|uniref:Uncharacterized protein n=1 Tax=Ustilago trichophora TaxID=86804 RepID=A0A5C3E1W4_9BASI|nr:uncharacterized protein UTRI_02140 [Ustilago trichophora]